MASPPWPPRRDRRPRCPGSVRGAASGRQHADTLVGRMPVRGRRTWGRGARHHDRGDGARPVGDRRRDRRHRLGIGSRGRLGPVRLDGRVGPGPRLPRLRPVPAGGRRLPPGSGRRRRGPGLLRDPRRQPGHRRVPAVVRVAVVRRDGPEPPRVPVPRRLAPLHRPLRGHPAGRGRTRAPHPTPSPPRRPGRARVAAPARGAARPLIQPAPAALRFGRSRPRACGSRRCRRGRPSSPPRSASPTPPPRPGGRRGC